MGGVGLLFAIDNLVNNYVPYLVHSFLTENDENIVSDVSFA